MSIKQDRAYRQLGLTVWPGWLVHVEGGEGSAVSSCYHLQSNICDLSFVANSFKLFLPICGEDSISTNTWIRLKSSSNAAVECCKSVNRSPEFWVKMPRLRPRNAHKCLLFLDCSYIILRYFSRATIQDTLQNLYKNFWKPQSRQNFAHELPIYIYVWQSGFICNILRCNEYSFDI